MKSNKLCRMKKKIFLPMLVSLQLLFGSCENNFDPYIYGALLQGEYPSTEQEYVSYMMICYLPYTTVWTYDMGSGGLQHGIHIQSGGTVRMFDSTSDICASATTVGADWERFTKGDYSNCFYYWRGNVDDGSNLNHFPKTAQITRMTEIIGTLEKAPLTALTEEKEFRDIYGMDVVEIPTNRPVIRKDLDDAVYMTKKEKFQAVVDEIEKAHEKGQPVLVGTITIETSELLSGMLKRRGIQHKVLNAKFHELEAEIVAEAGRHGAVTIATNMAGRGTDIKLDDEAKAAGGLKIIGTERHESRRIDNQLRGRSGRQGDPGESRFYISLEDDLMRLFGSERLMSIFKSLGVAENEQIEHKMLSSAIEKAQMKIEGNNYGIRKNLLEYDQVNNEQREIIYKERRRVLDGESMRDSIFKMITDIVDNTVDMCISDDQDTSDWNMQELNGLLIPIIPLQKIEILSLIHISEPTRH